MLGLLGLRNIADSAPSAASSGGYPQLSAEFIVQSNPDWVFLADTICCGQTPHTVAARPGWSTMKAVPQGQVVGLNDDIASRWGPRIVDLLQTVETAMSKHSADAVSTTLPQRPLVRRARDRGGRTCTDSALRPVSARRAVVVAFGALAGAVLLGVSIGPADVSFSAALRVLASHIPFVHFHSGVSRIDADILWQIRLPRVVLGGMVGAMLAGGGAAFQGVFRNPLADPYLLGVAAGAGLGATVVIVAGSRLSELLPLAAFAGAVGAVTLTYVVGATVGRQGATVSIVLAGVAVAALLTAIQTFLQQQHAPDLQAVYGWILGSLTVATWSDVVLILPYVALSAVVLIAHRRLLDVLRVGRGRGRQPGGEVLSRPPHRRGRGHTRHGGGGGGERPHRLRRHHRAPHRAPDHERQLPGRHAGVDDRRAPPS